MKFLLKDIELHLEDELIEQGEALIEQKQLDQLKEIEKNLWSARFIGDQTFEVEIQLKAKKIQDCTCDCDSFKKEKLCTHVVASLLALRTRLNEIEAARKAKAILKATKPPSKAVKLTPHNILETISHEELKSFVKTYAGTNRQFGLSLKAKFARKIYHPDTKEKYRMILDSTIKPHSKSNKKFSINVIRQINNIVETLFVQLEDALSLQDLTEAFAIIQVSFEKIYPILRRSVGKTNPFVSMLLQNLDYYEQLIQQEMAPLFKTQVWEFGLEEMQKNYYLRYKLIPIWYKILGQLATEANKVEQLIHILKTQLQSDSIDASLNVELLIIQLNLLEKIGDQEAIDSVLQENLNKPEILVAAVQDAIKKRDFKKASLLAHKALDNTTIIPFKNELEEILLQIAIEKKQKRAIKEFATKRFLASYDMKYYERLKANQTKNWEKTRAQLIENLENQIYSIARRDVLANIYFNEKLPEELLHYIQKIRSIDLLQRYDQFLIQYNKSACYQLYEELLDKYLQFHLGRKTAQKIRAVFYHLEKVGARDLKRKLLRKFRKNYKERHSLIEELADF